MKSNKTRSLERILILCVIAAVFSSMIISTRLAQQKNEATLHRLDEGWYRYVGENRVDLSLPARINVPKGQNLEIYYDGLEAQDGSRTLMTRAALYSVRMKVDGHVIYEYDDRGFRRNAQMKSKQECLAILPENPSGSTLTITYRNDGSDFFFLKPVYVGRSSEIMGKLWYSNLFTILSVFTMSIIAVVCLCAHLYLKFMHIEDSRMGSAALFLALCATWALTGSSITQQMWGSSPKLCVISTYAFMCLSLPVIHFVRSTQKMYKYYALDFLLYIAYGNILLQALMHIMISSNYSDMIPITHISHTVVVAVMAYLLWREYKATEDFEIQAVFQGLVILSVAGLLDLLLYWVFKSSHYGMMLELGVLVFIIRMLFAILSSMTSNIRFKAEAMVYKRLSREDRLTGLSNRRAFDEAMADIEQHANRYTDAALFFMDVNGLKVVNDKYGHHAGDELIISAAKCISFAFGSKGTCYRLGGDEFAAIITDPEYTPKQWVAQIDDALVHQNAMCHWPLSVAWGLSYLRDHGGNVKRSSDWLYEADQAMYKMKTDMKATRADLTEETK